MQRDDGGDAADSCAPDDGSGPVSLLVAGSEISRPLLRMPIMLSAAGRKKKT